MVRDELGRQVLALTHAAFLASEAGRWDDVVALYDRRGESFPLEEVSSEVAQRLVEYDRLVQSRARLVQKAIQSDLQRLQAQRRDLIRLKRSWTLSTQSSAQHIAKSV